MPITAFGRRCIYNYNPRVRKLRKIAMKKVTITAAIAAALLFTVATGLATVPTDSPRQYVFGHHGSVLPVW